MSILDEIKYENRDQYFTERKAIYNRWMAGHITTDEYNDLVDELKIKFS